MKSSTLAVLVAISLPLIAIGQSSDDSMDAAFHAFDAWVDTTREFVADVEFDAGDMDSFLAHYESFNAFGEDLDDDGEDDEFIDYEAILDDGRFRDWASEAGVDAEDWLKKSMRIIALNMQRQMAAGMAAMKAQGPEQERMIEQTCAQTDADTCNQMKEALKHSAAMFDHQQRRVADLATPTAGELALLDRYQGQLAGLMEAEDDEDEWDGADDWEDQEGEDD